MDIQLNKAVQIECSSDSGPMVLMPSSVATQWPVDLDLILPTTRWVDTRTFSGSDFVFFSGEPTLFFWSNAFGADCRSSVVGVFWRWISAPRTFLPPDNLDLDELDSAQETVIFECRTEDLVFFDPIIPGSDLSSECFRVKLSIGRLEVKTLLYTPREGVKMVVHPILRCAGPN
jgi:hypothetical protein